MHNGYETLYIYYFSGTGNAFSVAKWIEQVADLRGYKVQLINIASINTEKNATLHKNATIGFIFPTHGFNLPPIMLHFILFFPRARNNHVFIINTRGGLKMGKYFLPGLSGLAQYFSALILKLKGHKIRGMHPIDLPSNWISLHPGLKEKVVESIYLRRKTETEIFANKILTGKRDLRALRDLIQDLLITPVGILYYFLGRYFLAKTFMASSACDNCNQCIEKCPVKAIKLIDNRPFWTYKCESCMQCMNQCPKQAIETAHGFTIAMISLVNSIVLFQLYRMVHFPMWYYDTIYGYLLSIILNSMIILAFFIASCRIIHTLRRYKIVDRILIYSSLTQYHFWRKYRLRKMKFWKAFGFRNK